MTATKTRKTKPATSSAAAHKRALTFIAAAERAESADVDRQIEQITKERDELARRLAEWEQNSAPNKPKEPPRSADGCSMAQMLERLDWQPTRRREVAAMLDSVLVDLAAALRRSKSAAEFYNEAQALRAIMTDAQLGKLRSREGRTAFDAAFKRPQ